LGKAIHGFFMPVCPSAWINSAPNGRILMKFDIRVFFENLFEIASSINPLTPELNPSAQRCLPRFLLGILFLKGSLRDALMSRLALNG
jgi:hypothetical protein